jgi:hypothetical protein
MVGNFASHSTADFCLILFIHSNQHKLAHKNNKQNPTIQGKNYTSTFITSKTKGYYFTLASFK